MIFLVRRIITTEKEHLSEEDLFLYAEGVVDTVWTAFQTVSQGDGRHMGADPQSTSTDWPT